MNHCAGLLIAALLFSPFVSLAGPVSEGDIREINSKFELAYELYAQKRNTESSKAVINAYNLAAKKLATDYRLSDYAYYVAALHQNMGKYDIAEKYHNINLEIKKKFLRFPDGQLVIAYNNVASVLILKRKYQEALKMLANIDLETNKSHQEELSIVYVNLARAHFGLNELEKAEDYLTISMPLTKKYNGKRSVNYADANFLRAQIELTKGNRHAAIKYADESIQILRERDFTNNPLYESIERFMAQNKP